MSLDSIIDTLETWGGNIDFLKYSLFTTAFTSVLLLLSARIINRFATKFISRHHKNNKLLMRSKTILIYTVCTYAILDLFTPFQTVLKTILAGSGVLAVVIGLAAQEAAGNFINGMMILIFQPFRIGDLIKINEGELLGTVSDITLRHTIIKTMENTKIIIPNSVIDKAVLENITAVGNQKGNFLELEISYESDLQKAMAIIAEEIKQHPNYMDIRSPQQIKQGDPEVVTRLVEFGENGMRLKTTVYSKNNAQGYAMLSDIRIAIKQRFDKEGIEIPYPHRSISIKAEKMAAMKETDEEKRP